MGRYQHVKDWREVNRDKLADQSRRAISRKRAFVRQAKSVPCADCGRRYGYWVMQFDHVRGIKRFELAGKSLGSWGMKSILNEMAKCDVVCSNCHADRTYKRSMGGL
jgi:hypothetical protein